MKIQDFYTFSFDIYENTITSRDSIGGIVRTTSFKASHSCYVTLLDADERIIYGKNQVESTHRLFCDQCDIQSNNIVYIEHPEYRGWYGISVINNCQSPYVGINPLTHMEITLYRVEAPMIYEFSSSSSSSSSSSESSSSSSSYSSSSSSSGSSSSSSD